jgi:hypothetical protein
MTTPRYEHAVVAGTDGRIYAIGGIDASTISETNVVEIFDPKTNRWTTAAPMPTKRSYPTAAAGPDGRIYAIGGFSGFDDLNVVEVYTP